MKKLPTLRGRTVVNLFFESSTRTSSSFELAAKRLSADTMSIKAAGSSVDKGESLKDTALTLGAYDPDVIVIRHPQIGAPQLVAGVTGAHVVNAGDGKHQHPTQALLDLYTIQEELGRLEGLHVAIVGDVLHSRVARSNIQALALIGAHVTLVGPPALLPRGIEAMGCEVSTDIGAIRDADVVYVLRMQRERMAGGRELRAEPARVRGPLGRHARAAAAGPEGDAPRPDEPRRRDRPARRRLGRRADRDAGARRPRRPHGRPLRPAHPRAGPSRVAVAARWRSRDALRQGRAEGGPRRPRRPRARPGRGHRRAARRADRRRRHRRVGASRRARTGTASSTAQGSCSRRPSSTRTCTCARPAARTRRRSPPAPPPRRRAATARSSRCRTPTRSSTRPPCSAR